MSASIELNMHAPDSMIDFLGSDMPLPEIIPKPNVRIEVQDSNKAVKVLAAYWDGERNDWQAVIDDQLVYGEQAAACIKAIDVLGKLPAKPAGD